MFGQPSKAALQQENKALKHHVANLEAEVAALQQDGTRMATSYERRVFHLEQLGPALAEAFDGTVIDHEVVAATATETASAITTVGDANSKPLYIATTRPQLMKGELLLTATRFSEADVPPLVIDLQAETWGDVLPEDVEAIEGWIELATTGPAVEPDEGRHDRRFALLSKAVTKPAKGNADAPTAEITAISANGVSPHDTVGVER